MVVVRAFFFFLRFDDSRDLSVVVIGFEIRVDAIEKIPVWFGSDQVYIVSMTCGFNHVDMLFQFWRKQRDSKAEQQDRFLLEYLIGEMNHLILL